MTFAARLESAFHARNSLLCVGLDPDPKRLPEAFAQDLDGLEAWLKGVVDATAEYAVAFKPQIAYFHPLHAEPVLERVCRYIRETHPEHILVLDAKRNDIGSTAARYADEAFERYNADAVTVNPYLGGDAISPFTADPERGIFLLCRTSNPGAADLQSLPLQDGRTLYEAVADLASSPWNENGNVGLVVGATWPEELANLRQRAPELPFLVPGVGAQGGDPKAVLEAGLTANKTGLLINASRSILYAGNPTDNPETFLQASAQAAAQLNTELNGLRDSE